MQTQRFNRTIQSLVAAAFVTLTLAACSDKDPVGPEQEEQPATCTMTAPDGDAYVTLCDLDKPVRHVVIENLRAPRSHAYGVFFLGAVEAPASATGKIPDGQFRVLFYGGGNPAPAALIQVSFGPVDVVFEGDATFLNDGATFCFDITDGSTSASPAIVLWVSGQKGANCSTPSTLTASSAFATESAWEGATGVISNMAKGFFRYSTSGGTTPRVTLSSAPVL